MKIFNLQRDILKQMLKDKKSGKAHIYYDIDDEEGKVYVSDSYRIYIMDAEESCLDYKHCKKMNLKKFLDSKKTLEPVLDTMIVENNERTKIKLLKAKDFNIRIDESFFKYFDKVTFFKGSGPLDPLYCYESGNYEKFVGTLMPLSRSEKIEDIKLKE